MSDLRFEVPTNILLTGAGFTKNFGELLAHEIWSHIFNFPDVRSCPGLTKRVSDQWPDFELVYDTTVRRGNKRDEAEAVHKAVLAA